MLVSVRLYSRGTVASRSTQPYAKAGARYTPDGGGDFAYSKDLDGSPSPMDAAVATKRKFKSKRRKASDSPMMYRPPPPIGTPGYGAVYMEAAPSAGYTQNRPSMPYTEENRSQQDTSMIKPASNLAKLAAMLGKSSKNS